MKTVALICASVAMAFATSFAMLTIEKTDPKKLRSEKDLVFGQLVSDSKSAPALTSETRRLSKKKNTAVGHPTFVSPHARPIAIQNNRIFVVNTPSETVDVIDAKSQKVIHRVPVGIDPVSIALRPDGKEVWVSNHISDSVSVIDNDKKSPTYLNVIATVQEFDANRATSFDEPVGIAFASNEKAYVALSSENQIAVVDVAARKITNRLKIPAQDPLAIAVRNGKLYVIPFESNNKTQLSGGSRKNIDGELVTFDAWEHSITHNNVLSLGHVVDIVKHPDVPDRDLFVFDTETDKLIETVDSLGTLLYGLTVASDGTVFVAQTDARNDVNGRAGTKKHNISQLENRAFLNQITRINFDDGNDGTSERIELEPLPPQHPQPEKALATPFAIEISSDDSTLVVSAAASDKLFTVDAKSGRVLGRIGVDSVPRGIALQHEKSGQLASAWVLNAVSNTVSHVDLTDRDTPKVLSTVTLEDPTNTVLKRGRIAFETADASSTRTFSCASCHPDGHTDQLLWVLKTPVVSGGDQIMPRSTMPVRGLRDTEPYHWDGIPGDPYGGNNSAKVHGNTPPNSVAGDPHSSALHLIDGGLASTMAFEGEPLRNDEKKVGRLTSEQRDDMASFLLSIPFPPAQRRPYTDELTQRARDGFELFHILGDNDPSKRRPNVCGDCHRLPFLVSTNTPGTGMDAPTWRGAYDRYLILPQGRLNIMEFDFYARIANEGIPEKKMWQFSWGNRQRFNPIWDMVLEGSTGFSGALGRQVTLSKSTAKDEFTIDLMNALERSASEGAVVLEANGRLLKNEVSNSVELQWIDGKYISKTDGVQGLSSQEIILLAAGGSFVGTLTARHGSDADMIKSPQPAIWTLGPIEKQSGHQKFPILYPGTQTMKISGRHIRSDAKLIVDGHRANGSVTIENNDKVNIQLTSLPEPGLHLLQVQNPEGKFSNEFIFNVVESLDAVKELLAQRSGNDRDIRDAIAQAITRGDIDELRQVLKGQPRGVVNQRHRDSGSTPLSLAAMRGQLEIIKILIRRGARVNATNRDGNTALHTAAFFCREDIVKLLLAKGASTTTKSTRGETPIDVVSGKWSNELVGFYKLLDDSIDLGLDLEKIRTDRPNIAKVLQKQASEKESREKDRGRQ